MKKTKTPRYIPIIAIIAVLTIMIFYYTKYHKGNRQQDTIQVISTAMQDRIEGGFSVGMAMAVVSEDGEYYITEGTTEQGGSQKIDENTLFEIGSVTKTFTGVLLSMMVLEGKISLEDQANKYLPADSQLPSYEDTPILIKHLATHTSGLATIPNSLDITDPMEPYAGYTAAMFLDGLKAGKEELLFEPGTSFNYSNTGVALLGYIMAEISGQSYASLLQENILTPLGMNNSYLSLSEQNKTNFAKPYTGENAAKQWRLEPLFQATGGLISSAADMAKYIRANFTESAEGIYAAMQESHKPLMSVSGGTAGTTWRLEKNNDVVAHAGGTGGSSSYIMIDLAAKQGVMLLSNSSYSHADLAYRALDENAELIDTFDKREESYVGYYKFPLGLFDVARVYIDENESLRINIGYSDTRLNMISEDKYYSRAINGHFEFKKIAADEYELMYFDADGRKISSGEELAKDGDNVKSFLSVVR